MSRIKIITNFINESQERKLNMNDFRTEILRQFSGKAHVFRSDKQRQAIDGTPASVLSQYDAAGTGPANRFKIGIKVCYPLTDYVDWLCARVSKAG